MNIGTAYRILGAKSTDDMNIVRKKYHKLAVKFHPDHNKSSSADKTMKELNLAFDTVVAKKLQAVSGDEKLNYSDVIGLLRTQYNLDLNGAVSIVNIFNSIRSGRGRISREEMLSATNFVGGLFDIIVTMVRKKKGLL